MKPTWTKSWEEIYKKLNTIYIISKGRPRCLTAKTLTRIEYPGKWFIVCGTNDKTIPEYIKNWGEERILIFDWEEEVKDSELLDNFGYENMPSGAVPVRNATIKISQRNGELRHWQFDDDYPAFVKYWKGKNHRMDGKTLQFEIAKLALFAYQTGLKNIGFEPTSSTFPDQAFEIVKRVFNAHNLPSEEGKAIKWRSRLNDDLINAIDTLTHGGFEMSVKYLGLNLLPTQSESGGLTDLYQNEGTVRKTAYAIMVNPVAVTLVIKFGRYHHQCIWKNIVPKLLSDKYARY